jgi:hypothetical protein
MVAWCGNCKRPVNQYCDICGENFGIVVCEKYACGGTMMCPICGGKDLRPMKDTKIGPDPYDYSKLSKDDRDAIKTGGAPLKPDEIPQGAPSKCPMCGVDLQKTWKFCPNCGVSFGVKK